MTPTASTSPTGRSTGEAWELIVPGRPTSKGNSKRAFISKGGRAFVAPAKGAKQAEASLRAYAAAHAPTELFTGPVRLDVQFRFRIPNKAQATKRKPAKLLPGDLHDRKPDRGNLLKMLEDSLKGIAYLDDGQTATGILEKVWWHQDETWFRVTQITRDQR